MEYYGHLGSTPAKNRGECRQKFIDSPKNTHLYPAISWK